MKPNKQQGFFKPIVFILDFYSVSHRKQIFFRIPIYVNIFYYKNFQMILNRILVIFQVEQNLFDSYGKFFLFLQTAADAFLLAILSISLLFLTELYRHFTVNLLAKIPLLKFKELKQLTLKYQLLIRMDCDKVFEKREYATKLVFECKMR